MKIKCAKAECELCGKVSTMQVFYNKSGAVKYAIARHTKAERIVSHSLNITSKP